MLSVLWFISSRISTSGSNFIKAEKSRHYVSTFDNFLLKTFCRHVSSCRLLHWSCFPGILQVYEPIYLEHLSLHLWKCVFVYVHGVVKKLLLLQYTRCSLLYKTCRFKKLSGKCCKLRENLWIFSEDVCWNLIFRSF